VNGIVDGDGTALIVAAREGNKTLVEFLLAHGADVNLAASGDGNPLIMAAREGHLEIVRLLLDRGARIDEVVEGDENPLIQASASGELEVVKLLIARGANVNARALSHQPNGEWRTPLGMARKEGHKAVVDVLLAAGAQE
jgi:ankyrin repeat protein